MKSIYAFILIVVLQSIWMPPHSEAALQIRIKEKRMSVDLEKVPLEDALHSIQIQTGIWYRGDPSVLSRAVSLKFSNLPLEEGIGRLLGSINHVLIYDEKRNVVGAVIFGGSAVDEGTARRGLSPPETGTFPSLPERSYRSEPAAKAWTVRQNSDRNPFEIKETAENPFKTGPTVASGDVFAPKKAGAGKNLSEKGHSTGAGEVFSPGNSKLVDDPFGPDPFKTELDPFAADKDPFKTFSDTEK